MFYTVGQICDTPIRSNHSFWTDRRRTRLWAPISPITIISSFHFCLNLVYDGLLPNTLNCELVGFCNVLYRFVSIFLLCIYIGVKNFLDETTKFSRITRPFLKNAAARLWRKITFVQFLLCWTFKVSSGSNIPSKKAKYFHLLSFYDNFRRPISKMILPIRDNVRAFSRSNYI